jgi:hypothetical protein
MRGVRARRELADRGAPSNDACVMHVCAGRVRGVRLRTEARALRDVCVMRVCAGRVRGVSLRTEARASVMRV